MLDKLIEQYPGDKHWVKVAIKNLTGSVWEFGKELVKFLEFLASRPTCGVEQRKFLDVIEKDGVIEDGNLGQTMYIGETSMSEISSNDFNPISLEKVIKGE